MRELYEKLEPIIEEYGFQLVKNAVDSMWDEYEEPYDESGFDPYLGCFTGDC